MTVVRIDAITVPADSGDELARRFAERAGGEAAHPVGIDSELWSYEVAGGSAR